MASDRRIFGLETEYAIFFQAAPGEPRRPDGLTIFTAISQAVLSRVKALSAKHRKAGHFLENGGFLHYEGRHDTSAQGLLEFSTPECRTARELARYDKAGERFLSDALPEAERSLASAGFHGSLTLGKNSQDSYGNTYGSHENYFVRDPLPRASLVLAHALLVMFVLLTLPFVLLASIVRLLSKLTYFLVYGLILFFGLVTILVVSVSPSLRQRSGPVSQRIDRALESFEAWVRDPLRRGYGMFFHYLFLPLARLLSAFLRLFVFRSIRRHLPTFLSTRQIFTGAGHFSHAPGEPLFSVSEKARAISSVARLYWDDARPMLDLKNFAFVAGDSLLLPRLSALQDEKRLQVMLSDSNMNEFAEYLKVGATALVLQTIEAGAMPEGLRVEDPVAALHLVAGDPDLKEELPLVDGRRLTALEIQREILAACERLVRSQPAVSIADVEVLRGWREVLADLEKDPASTADRVDWVLKHRFLCEALEGSAELQELLPWREAVWAAERAGVELCGDGRDLERLRALLPQPYWKRLITHMHEHRLDPAKLKPMADLIYAAKKVDLKYHDISPGRGYYQRAREAGLVRTLFDDADVTQAVHSPPESTRAFLRGGFVKRHYRDPKGRVNWTLGKARKTKVRFKDPFFDQD